MERIKLFINKKHLTFAITVNLLIYFTSLIFRTLRYETNDDIIISYLFGGIKVANKTSIAIYPNILVGKLFNVLYEKIPAVNWFYVVECLLVFISATIMCYIMKKYIRNEYIKYLLIIIYEFIIILSCYQCFNYTKVANITMATGAFSFLHFLIYGKSKHNVLYLIFFGAHAICGFLIRKEIPALCILFILAFLIYNLKTIIQKKLIKKIVISGLIIGSIMVGFIIINSLGYTYEEYATYSEYMNERIKIVDYMIPKYKNLSEESKEQLKEYNISENDYMMARSWLFFDSNYFDLDMFKKINEVVDNEKKQNIIFYHFQRSFVIFHIFTEYTIAILLLFIFLRNYMKKEVNIIFLVMFTYFFIFTLMMRLEPRIVYGVVYNSLLMISYFLIQTDKEFDFPEKVVRRFRIILPIISIFFISTLFTKPTNSLDVVNQDNLIKEITENKDNLYIHAVGGKSDEIYTHMQPFINEDNDTFSNFQATSGWMTMHPEYERWFEERGIYDRGAMFFEDNVYFIGNDEHVEYFTTYLSEHYYETEAVFYKELDGWKLWQFKKKI